MANSLDEASKEMSGILNGLFSRDSSSSSKNAATAGNSGNGTGLETSFGGPGILNATQYNFEGLRGSDLGTAAKGAKNSIYTDEEQQAAIDKNKGRQQAVQGNWNKSVKDAIVSWHDENLAQNNPYGNLNNKTYNQTLNLSRMADRFNNHLDWEPGTVGRTTYHLGNVEGDTGKAYRRDPIETQEMRQMRANENIDALARQGQAGLQSDMNRYGLDLQRQSDTNQATFAQQLGLGQDDINRALQNALIQGEYTQPNSMQIQMKMQRFVQEIALESKTKLGQYLYNTYQKCGPVVASYISQVVSGQKGMSFDELLSSEYIQSAINASGARTSEEKLEVYKTLYATLSTAAAQFMMQGAAQGFTQGLSNYR